MYKIIYDGKNYEVYDLSKEANVDISQVGIPDFQIGYKTIRTELGPMVVPYTSKITMFALDKKEGMKDIRREFIAYQENLKQIIFDNM